jgi:GAF domain-containing protein
MQAPDLPEDEVYRLEALKSLDLLDSQEEPDFNSAVHLGRALFGVPICLISLIDADRQWFKAKVGLDAAETPRDISFCGHAILGRDALVILNALEDPRFADNPLVTGPPNIRFYAGAPIRLPSGYCIGTLCLISPEPRADFTLEDRERLAHLAALAMNVITVRALRAELDAERMAADRMAAILDSVDIPMALTDAGGRISR